jgi:hypothetical protein
MQAPGANKTISIFVYRLSAILGYRPLPRTHPVIIRAAHQRRGRILPRPLPPHHHRPHHLSPSPPRQHPQSPARRGLNPRGTIPRGRYELGQERERGGRCRWAC